MTKTRTMTFFILAFTLLPLAPVFTLIQGITPPKIHALNTTENKPSPIVNMTVAAFKDIKQSYNNIDAWGMLTSLDLTKCNPETIRSAKKIKQYVVELCELIEMKRFGECTIVYFGEDEAVAGFSMTQLIETSLISGHFANLSNNSYIDIFSCKPYDPNVVAEFTKNFFDAEECTINVVLRK